MCKYSWEVYVLCIFELSSEDEVCSRLVGDVTSVVSDHLNTCSST